MQRKAIISMEMILKLCGVFHDKSLLFVLEDYGGSLAMCSFFIGIIDIH